MPALLLVPVGLGPKASLIGPLAVAVPGELQGLGELWRLFGSKPWADLVTPAVELARSGFAAHPYLVYVMSGPQNEKRIAVRQCEVLLPGGLASSSVTFTAAVLCDDSTRTHCET